MLNERLIAGFLCLGETLNYTEAAQRLYLTHQALSKQIAKLEEELGYQLFVRTTRSVTLTAVGELYYRYFKGERERWAQVCLEAEHLARIQVNDLRIGFPLGIRPPAFFGAMVRRFTQEPQGASVHVEWHDVDQLTRLFEAGTLDVVFSLDDSGLEVHPDAEGVRIRPCRLVLAAAADHPAWQEGGLSAFSGETFYYEQESTPESTNEMRTVMLGVLQSAGITEPRLELVPNIQSRQSAVELGMGCCLCVDLDELCTSTGIRTCDLNRSPTHLSCYWHKASAKRPVQEFAARMKKAKAVDYSI